MYRSVALYLFVMLVGNQVKVIEACRSDSDQEALLEIATIGTVEKVEAEDGKDWALIAFASGSEWIMEEKFPKFEGLAALPCSGGEPKSEELEMLDVIATAAIFLHYNFSSSEVIFKMILVLEIKTIEALSLWQNKS